MVERLPDRVRPPEQLRFQAELGVQNVPIVSADSLVPVPGCGDTERGVESIAIDEGDAGRWVLADEGERGRGSEDSGADDDV